MPRNPETKVIVRAENRTAKAFKEVNSGLGRMSASFKAFGAIAAGVFAGSFVRGVRNSATALGEISDVADKLGVTTDALQELRFAAEQAGVKVASFDVGFQRFTRRVADAAAGNKQLAKTFREFNIELVNSNGRLKSNEAVFLEFADAIAGADDQGQRILKTFQLFDTEGVDLVRLLQQGSQAINEFREEARLMGAVVDESLIRKADAADKKLDALSRVVRLQLNVALAEAAPLLVSMASGLANAARFASKFIDAFKSTETRTNIQGLTEQLEILQRRRQEIYDKFANKPFLYFGKERDKERLAKINEEISKTRQRIAELETADKTGLITAGGTPPKGLPVIKKQITEVRDEWDVAFDLIDAQFKQLDQEWARGFTGLEVAKKQAKETKKETEKVNDVARDLGFVFQSSFESAITQGEKLRDVLKGILKDIVAIAARKLITEPLGNFVSGLVSGFFAEGTNYAPGGLAVVGEKGPELVNLPRGSQVIPNDALGGLGGITINVDARGSGDPMAVERGVRRAVQESVATLRNMKVRGALPEFA